MIYDGFIFFNELDILEVRLNTLSPHVDEFILVESNKTFQGNPKPLFYAENKARFSKFHDRLIHIVVDDMPVEPEPTTWQREFHQRNCIMRGVPDSSKGDDVLMVSDVDEIPDLSKLTSWNTPCGWELEYSYYYVDLLTGASWPCVMAATLKQIREQFKNSPHALREHRYDSKKSRDGWHFSYTGGVETIKTKIESFSHVEYRDCADMDRITKAVTVEWKNGKDLFGRPRDFKKLDDFSKLPKWLVENKEKFSHLFCL